MWVRKRRLGVAAALVAGAALALDAAPRQAAPQAGGAPARVVAIGDIHGDADAFTALLGQLGLVDATRHWTGGAATLVQVGDTIDRGPKSREVMDLLMRLQQDAPRAGGRVVVLLGNHEAMNLYGDLAYVPPSEYASFSTSNSARRQREAWQAYAALFGGRPPTAHDDWIAAHPAGFVEQREAFGPHGRYGKWLRTLPAVARVGDSLFVHGGISGDLAAWPIERINRTIAGEIKAFDDDARFLVDDRLALPFFTLKEFATAARAAVARGEPAFAHLTDPDDWWSVRDEGPLWFRGYAEWPDDRLSPLVDAVLTGMGDGAARIVVGHTTEPGQVVVRARGRVFLIDTGLLAGYVPGGRPSALVITAAGVQIVYGSRSDAVSPQPRAASGGAR